jgi:hypothetical protein
MKSMIALRAKLVRFKESQPGQGLALTSAGPGTDPAPDVQTIKGDKTP